MTPPKVRFRYRLTTQQRLDLLCVMLLLVLLTCQQLFWRSNWWLSCSIIAAVCLLAILHRWALKPLHNELQALNLHAQNLQDGSFNTSANQHKVHELAPLANSLNLMSEQLRNERATLYQRELLLDTVLQSSPSAMVLTDRNNTVLMSNPAARQLFSAGKAIDGNKLTSLLSTQPVLANAVLSQQQGLVHLPDGAVWHLSQNQFQLNQKLHKLVLLKPMTREIQREELSAWKKLLRVIGHELNNTLAPLSSLAYSGRELATQRHQPQLSQLFNTISERCQHLNQFVQAYIHFAKLPPPAKTVINWPRLINQLQDQYEFELLGDLPQGSWQADERQLTQLLLNLLKNAHESGSLLSQITLSFVMQSDSLKLILQDGGGGMTEEVMQHALVPFYTSKEHGSGIGLTLCRDIAEAHGGSLRLRNHQNGLEVTLTLPREAEPAE